jgi:hypothetical protein
MSEHIRTIEIEGQKFEVDMRTAKTIDKFRVGDKVKLLTKNYSGYRTHPGVIVGIDAFAKLPTIVIAYIDDVLSAGGNLRMAYFNSQSEDTELCPMVEDDVMPNRETVRSYFDKAIAKKHLEIEAIVTQKEYFLRQYGTVIGTVAGDMSPVMEDD